MPNIITNGIRAYYESYGKGEPLILVHGLGSSHLEWEYVVPILKEHFKVIIYDVRGHGNTEVPKGPYSISLFANDLKKLMDELEIKSANIGGISMGGMIAFQFAVDFPKRVKKLMIINAVPDVKVKTLDEKLILYSRLAMFKALGFEKTAEVLAFRLFPKWSQKELRHKSVERFKRNDERSYKASLNAIVGWGIGERIKEIKAPTIVISAETDYLPIETKEAYVSKMQNASLAIIKNSKHASSQDAPEELAQLIIDFCEIKRKGRAQEVQV